MDREGSRISRCGRGGDVSHELRGNSKPDTGSAMISVFPADRDSSGFCRLGATKGAGTGKVPALHRRFDRPFSHFRIERASGGIQLPEDSIGTCDPMHDPIWKTICDSRVGLVSAGRWIHDVAGACDHEQQQGTPASDRRAGAAGFSLFGRTTRDQQEISQEPYQGTTVSRRAVPNLGLHLWPFTCSPC